jgi:hypothetical protein
VIGHIEANFLKPEQKIAILRKHLIDQVPVSDMCDKHTITLVKATPRGDGEQATDDIASNPTGDWALQGSNIREASMLLVTGNDPSAVAATPAPAAFQ